MWSLENVLSSDFGELGAELVGAWEGLFLSPELRKNLDALAEGDYLLGKGFTKSDLNGFTTFVNNVFGAVKNTLTTRINMTNGFSLIHLDVQIKTMLLRAKSLNLSAHEIDDFLFVSCRTNKQIPHKELMKQMDNWINIIKTRGYPYKFDGVGQFNQFSGELKTGLNDLGISIADVRVQGSSLRTPDANDVDLVAMVSQGDFDNFIISKYDGAIFKNGINVEISGMSTQELENLADDILANRSLYNSKAYSDFRYTVHSQIINAKGSKNIIPGFKTLKNDISNSYPGLNIENIAVQPTGGGFDLEPFMKL